MDIIRNIERKFGQLLGRDVPRPTSRDQGPTAVTGRFCDYGHAVFEGNNLCNYGHRPL